MERQIILVPVLICKHARQRKNSGYIQGSDLTTCSLFGKLRCLQCERQRIDIQLSSALDQTALHLQANGDGTPFTLCTQMFEYQGFKILKPIRYACSNI